MATKRRRTLSKRNKRTSCKRGGCGGCPQQQPLVKSPGFFAGGKRNKKCSGGGALGPASLPADFDTDHKFSYSFSDHADDPLNPAVQIGSRQLPNITGGKKRKNKTNRKSKRGGGDQMLDSYNKNLLSTGVSLPGAEMGKQIISGNPEQYDSTLKTPAFI